MAGELSMPTISEKGHRSLRGAVLLPGPQPMSRMRSGSCSSTRDIRSWTGRVRSCLNFRYFSGSQSDMLSSNLLNAPHVRPSAITTLLFERGFDRTSGRCDPTKVLGANIPPLRKDDLQIQEVAQNALWSGIRIGSTKYDEMGDAEHTTSQHCPCISFKQNERSARSKL